MRGREAEPKKVRPRGSEAPPRLAWVRTGCWSAMLTAMPEAKAAGPPLAAQLPVEALGAPDSEAARRPPWSKTSRR